MVASCCLCGCLWLLLVACVVVFWLGDAVIVGVMQRHGKSSLHMCRKALEVMANLVLDERSRIVWAEAGACDGKTETDHRWV